VGVRTQTGPLCIGVRMPAVADVGAGADTKIVGNPGSWVSKLVWFGPCRVAGRLWGFCLQRTDQRSGQCP
jgi:hypothetical protein